MSFLTQLISDTGFFQYGVVNTADIRFCQEVRVICEQNVCRRYGTTWACPPAVGTVEECEQRLKSYEKMLVLTGKYDLEDSFDFEGMMDGAKTFSRICRTFAAAIRPKLKNFLMFSNEGCDMCQQCTYPDAPCRFPDSAQGSLEANGIFVSELAAQAGVRYNNGPNTVTYFGALVCDGKDLDALFAME